MGKYTALFLGRSELVRHCTRPDQDVTVTSTKEWGQTWLRPCHGGVVARAHAVRALQMHLLQGKLFEVGTG